MSATAIGVCRLICHVCQSHHIWSKGEVPGSSPHSQTVLQNREQSASPTACGHLLRGLPAPAFSETWVNSPQMDRPEFRGQLLPRLVPAHSPPLGILSQPRSRAGKQQVPSDPKFISSSNPSNSPMRLFCYLIVTVKGKTCYYTQVTGGTTHKFSNHGAHGGKGRAVGPTPPCRCAQAWPELTLLPGPNSLPPDFQSPR